VRLKVASRKSDLARWQSVQVARALESLAEKPHTEFIFKASLGDQDLDTPLANMGAKGVFTEDFYSDLTSGHCDLVVHSWKDLPVEAREQTHIAMTLPRADVRDIFLISEAAWQAAVAAGKLQVLTSSPRRVYNLTACLKELLPAPLEIEFVNVRGNVPTRLGKMHAQNCALVLAKAGLDRLLHAEKEGFLTDVSVRGLIKDCRFMILPMSLNPSAAAQGALAVEVLKDKEQLNAMCAKLSDEKTYSSVQQERELLAGYGGGCHQKIGVNILAREYGRIVSLRGLTDDGVVLERWAIENSTPWEKARFRDDIFPIRARENSWFDRQPVLINEDLNAKPALFVARSEALPRGFKPSPKQLVWTAGTQTWTRMAKLGIWVHGTFEGLGEAEDPGLGDLAGPVTWTKLSHTRGYARPGTEMVATYQLIPKKHHPDLAGKTHFYWMSSTSFERARQLFPDQVNNGYNASGPGSTFDYIRRVPGLKHPPKVFIGLEQFLAETVP
jgi:hydroxymethylbilane synthase